jgi:hypothetical protein
MNGTGIGECIMRCPLCRCMHCHGGHQRAHLHSRPGSTYFIYQPPVIRSPPARRESGLLGVLDGTVNVSLINADEED